MSITYQPLTARVSIINVINNRAIHRRNKLSQDNVVLWNAIKGGNNTNVPWKMEFKNNNTVSFSHPQNQTYRLNARGGAKSQKESIMLYGKNSTPDKNEIFTLEFYDEYRFRIHASWNYNFVMCVTSSSPGNGTELVFDDSSKISSSYYPFPGDNYYNTMQSLFYLYDLDNEKYLCKSDFVFQEYTYKQFLNTVDIITYQDTDYSIHRRGNGKSDRNTYVHIWKGNNDDSKWILKIGNNGICSFTNTKLNTDHLSSLGSKCSSSQQDLGVWVGSETPAGNERFKLVPIDNTTFRIQCDCNNKFYIYTCDNSLKNGVKLVTTSDAIATQGNAFLTRGSFKFWIKDKNRYLTVSDIATVSFPQIVIDQKQQEPEDTFVKELTLYDNGRLIEEAKKAIGNETTNSKVPSILPNGSLKYQDFSDPKKSHSVNQKIKEIPINPISTTNDFNVVKTEFYNIINLNGSKSNIINLMKPENNHIQKAFEITADFKKTGKEYIYDYFSKVSPTSGLLKIMYEAYKSDNFIVEDGYLSKCKAIYDHPYYSKDIIDCDYSDMIIGISRLIDSYTEKGKISKEAAKNLFFEGEKLRSWCVNSFVLHKFIKNLYPDIDTFVPVLKKDSKINFDTTPSNKINKDESFSAAETKHVYYWDCAISDWSYPFIPVSIKKENGEYVMYFDNKVSELIYTPTNILFESDKEPKSYETKFNNPEIECSIGKRYGAAIIKRADVKPSLVNNITMWTINPDHWTCEGNREAKCERTRCAIKRRRNAEPITGEPGPGNGESEEIKSGYINYTNIYGKKIKDAGLGESTFFKQNDIKTYVNNEVPSNESNASVLEHAAALNTEFKDIDMRKASNYVSRQKGGNVSKEFKCCKDPSWFCHTYVHVNYVDNNSLNSTYNNISKTNTFDPITKSIWYKGYNFWFDLSGAIDEVSPTNNELIKNGSTVYIDNAKSGISPCSANFINITEDIMRVDERLALVYKIYVENNIENIANQLSQDLYEMCKLHPEILIISRLKGYLKHTSNITGGNGLYTNIESPLCPPIIHVDKPLLMPYEYYISSNSIKFTRTKTTNGYQIVGYEEPEGVNGLDGIFSHVGSEFATIGGTQIPTLVIPNKSNPIDYLDKNILSVKAVNESDLQNFGENGIGLVFRTRPLSNNTIYSEDSELDEALKSSNAVGSINIKAPIVKVEETQNDLHFFYSTAGDNIKILEFDNNAYSTGVSEFSLENDKTAILISKNIVKDTLSLPTAFRTRYKQDISFSTK